MSETESMMKLKKKEYQSMVMVSMDHGYFKTTV